MREGTSRQGGGTRRLTTGIRAAIFAVAIALGTTPATAGTILLLVKRGGASISVDQAVRDHLALLGHRVTIAYEDAKPDSAAGMDLVLISGTVPAKDVDPGWRGSPVPLLTWESNFVDDLAMTGKRHDTDFGDVANERFLWIVNAPHPMAAGLPAGVANVHVKQGPMGWGKPGLGASIIATIYGQPEKAAIFGYEKGATMDYEALAPARRVMFFLDNDGFGNLSATGLTLFDAAIAWAMASAAEGCMIAIAPRSCPSTNPAAVDRQVGKPRR